MIRTSTSEGRAYNFGFELSTIGQLDDSVRDRLVRSAMTEGGLTALYKATGQCFPVVSQEQCGGFVRAVVLDPYTDYRTTCVVIAADEGWAFDDGWTFHVVTNRDAS